MSVNVSPPAGGGVVGWVLLALWAFVTGFFAFCGCAFASWVLARV